MNFKPCWIMPDKSTGSVVPLFEKSFVLKQEAKSAFLSITALGVYEAQLNGKRVGKFILAPGWTCYHDRLQVQRYDVLPLLQKENQLDILVGPGWYRGDIARFFRAPIQDEYRKNPPALCLNLEILYKDGTKEIIRSDETFSWGESPVRFSEIYDGEIYDASFVPHCTESVLPFQGPDDTLICQEGEEVQEMERIFPREIFTTPKGETVVDFGQNLTGYVEISLTAREGETADLSFAEVMDQEGNFYTENYRDAKAVYHYTCREGKQSYKPHLTFFGFRYIRVNQFPGKVKKENFTAIAVHSQMKRTGFLSSSDPLLNQLFDNIIWGQKGNFLDVPTDCPQRDERLGWTGDAQVFARTACLNFDTEKFFSKWMKDIYSDQLKYGMVPHVVPNVLNHQKGCPAWGDAAVVCPWQVYLAYGNREILENQFDSMKRWVDYISSVTTTPNLWTGNQDAYGDWLGLDAPSGSYKGSTDPDLIGTAFYAYSASLFIKAGHILKKDVKAYENLYERILSAFQKTYTDYPTQTACVLAAHFHLAQDPQKAADKLAGMIRQTGHLETGFVGTPYLLHVLTDFGYEELAWDLLLRKEYPSWLYPVLKGATTVWEHWDGIHEDGTFWSRDMNSFNHYAYGAVADWVYTKACGIETMEEYPGYEKILIHPHPDPRLSFLEAKLETRHGLVSSRWKKLEKGFQFDISTPVPAKIVLKNQEQLVSPGQYRFYTE